HSERAAYLDHPAVIGAVVANSPAEQAGLQPGDRIVRLGNLQDPTWQKLSIEAALTGAGKAQLEIEREGARLPLDLTLPDNVSEDPFAVGWIPDSRPVVQAVVADGPAQRAGLQVGDVLLELDGEPLRPNLETNVFSDRLQETEGAPVVVTIERGGERRQVTIRPEFGDHPDGKRWIIGIQMGPQMVQKELSFPGAFQASIQRNVELTGLMLTLVGRLVTGRASLQAVQGPVGIVYISGQVVAQGGLLALLNLAAVISLSLGVLNLLPIPILDGGHLLTFAIEAVLRRELSLRFKERMVQVGLVFLVLLFVVVMYNDIARILTN
ncbi:MAG: RIP metalloprotease RseP, partial [Terriglobia bacterium]